MEPQNTFPTNECQINSSGHKRRPSIGKSMPVTALFLNIPHPPSSKLKSYSTLSRDGLSPEMELPPKYFQVNDDENEMNLNKDTKRIIGVESESYIVDESDRDSLVKNHANNRKPCLACLEKSKKNMSALDELCSKLCDNECKMLSSMEGQIRKDVDDEVDFRNRNESLHIKRKPCSKIDKQRKKFLDDILFNANDDDDNDNDDDDDDIESNNTGGILCENFGKFKIPKNPQEFHKKFAIAEALAKTSMMTSPAAKRRIAARKIQLERDYCNSSPTGSDDEQFEPPRELLLYLVRMGSFNSAPKINNPDSQDDFLEIPNGLTVGDLLRHCKIMRGEQRPQLLERFFLKPFENGPVICNDITDGVRVLNLNAVSKICSNPVSSPKNLRILQWNILSQTLGQHNDGFVQCPDEALTWENRKYLIVEEILKNNPDVICLQEVDHFKFLERVLGSQDYCGIFFPKPDSPCLYIEENNGPDGCAIFYKRDKFELVNSHTRILEVWRVQSNQVAIVANLRSHQTGKEVSVCTTHLKARNGALLSKLRNEQGKDLLKFLNEAAEGRPTLLCGDFNAEPIEPVYSTVLSYKNLGFASAYSDIVAKEKNAGKAIVSSENKTNEKQIDGEFIRTPAEISASNEPPYTTWKIREEGEVCHTIDYVFYTKNNLKVLNCLSFPQEAEIGQNRTPSFQYPSDHFSLLCDFEILDSN